MFFFWVDVVYMDGLSGMFLFEDWCYHHGVVDDGTGRKVCRSFKDFLKGFLLFFLRSAAPLYRASTVESSQITLFSARHVSLHLILLARY